ncbi:DUF4054 domain-containing structural protein [Rhizobium phage RHph_I65]|nr:DUF4054 domain-containing structural protein [Rhizobium phage RHph_I65]
MVDTPTPAEFKARYPEFEPVDDALVSLVTPEASRYVDDGWEQTDQKPAIMLMIAHLLSMDGYPARVTNPGGWNGQTAGREMTSRRVGDVQTTYAQRSTAGGNSSAFSSDLLSTLYGRRFLSLMRLNAPTIGVV